ncbi:glycosyltransferase [Limosilactobacillus vaginalis]|uniref:glycosyltransferase n=1 Tax=Limosilactobacillus vaginalis TaxID=1633 RepID=UPI0025A390D1|nr:glycosyltransferase [Limosilactobacillus vaginalis]MDM8303803.1 glycosyltransferase [Limosilactobacillus vaginalis]
MKKKIILLVANTASMIYEFNLHNIDILQELGAEVHVATNFINPGPINNKIDLKLKRILNEKKVSYHQVDFMKGIGNHKSNVKAMKQLCSLCDQFKFDGIHAQSPLGGIIARRVAHRKNIKLLYTAHGFQFFKGGPLLDWLIFFPVEWFYGVWTNALVTINTDDYNASKYLPIKRRYYIPGVGIDSNSVISMTLKNKEKIRQLWRKKLGLEKNDFLIISVGELSNRKNHETVLRALKLINNPNVKYVIAGVGKNKERLIGLINKYHLERQVQLLGYVDDLNGLYYAADLNAFVSTREGLGLGGLDGVVRGLYIIGTQSTGMKDYIDSEKIGLLLKNPRDPQELANKIKKVISGKPKIPNNEAIRIMDKFGHDNVDKRMHNIYHKEFFA